MKTIRHQGKYLKLVDFDGWEYVERVGNQEAAIIVPLIADEEGDKIVLIREWRVPLQKYIIGLPAGLVGDHKDEAPDVAAARELTEETGYSSGRMRHLTSGPPSSGLSNEMLHFYLADRLTKVSDDVGVGGEDITVHVVPVSEAELWINSQKDSMIDPKVFLGLYFAQTMKVE